MAGYFGLRIVNPSRFAHFCAPCAPNRENEAKVVFTWPSREFSPSSAQGAAQEGSLRELADPEPAADAGSPATSAHRDRDYSKSGIAARDRGH
jgi:hypothetical protein